MASSNLPRGNLYCTFLIVLLLSFLMLFILRDVLLKNRKLYDDVIPGCAAKKLYTVLKLPKWIVL